MAVEIATAYVNIVPSAKGFGRSLAREVGGDMKSAGAALGSEAGGSFSSSFLGSLGGLAEKASIGLAGIGIAAGGWGLKIASQNEQASISFETMLGSAEKAEKFLADLKNFAATTPFEFPELQKASSSLISAGFNADKVIPIMTTLGDVTAGMGTGSEGIKRATIALQQMAAAGRITGEDLNQLRDAGVPVFDLLAAATGKTKEEIADLAQKGKLGKKEMEQLFAALETGKGLEKFDGLMEKQSQSLEGLFSTFKDTLGQGLADAMAPVIPILKDVLKIVTDVLNPLLKTVGPQLANVFGKLALGLAEIIRVGQPIVEAVVAVAGALVDALLPAIGALMPFLVETADVFAGALIMAFQTVTPVITELVRAIGPLLPMLARLTGTAFVILIRLASELVTAMTPVIEQVVGDLLMLLPGLIPLWIDLAKAFLPLFPAFSRLLLALGPLITLFLTFQTQVLVKFGPQLVPLVDKLVEFARVGMEELIPFIEKAVGWITRFFDAFISGDQTKIDEIGKEISTKLQAAWDNDVKPAFLKGLDILKEELAKWWDNTAFPWLQEKAQQVGDNFLGWMKNTAPGQIAVASANMFIGMYNEFVATINNIVNAWNGLRFGEVKVGDNVIFAGFSPPQVELLHQLDHWAKGGRPATNRPSVVGELGPELFVPDTAGTIVPNNAMGGFNIEHLEVTGQDRPSDTAFALRSELRWLALTTGVA